MKKFSMELLELYREREREIKDRLRDFELAGFRPEKQVFQELCFCLLTPGSSALGADSAIRELVRTGLLFEGNEESVAGVLKGRARFHNNKAKSIVRARGFLGGELTGILRIKDNKKAREMLVENVRGLGWKEASHFLRNVGKGRDLAIVDRHILKNLKEFGVIGDIPKSMTKNRYFLIEEKIKKFSEGIGIPMEELDLLLWSKETGKVFK